MNRKAFFEAAGHFSGWVRGLALQTKASLREAEDMLCRKDEPSPYSPPSRVIVLLNIRAIDKKLTEVIAAYDRLCEAAGLEPPYELTLALRDAPEEVHDKVRRALAKQLGWPPICEESDGSSSLQASVPAS